jgi:hypothetical protein
MTTAAFNNSKTPGIIVSEIRMMRSAFSGVHFLAEGEDDIRFWKHHLKLQNVNLVDCGGKHNLIGAAHLINNAGNSALPAATGVYDPDFERLHGTAPHLPAMLVQTDANDLETTLLQSDALHRVLTEYADPARLKSFENRSGISVAMHIEQSSREFGRLRFLNELIGYGVNFKHLSPYRFVSDHDWSLNLPELKAEFAQLAAISLPQLEAELLAHCPPAAPWAYSQGHDAVRILAQGLRRCIGHHPMDEKNVTRLLRLCYTDTMLRQTTMHASLCAIQAGLPLPLFP